MKKIALLILSTFLIGSERIYAWCACGDGAASNICIGSDWTPVFGTVHTFDTTNVLVAPTYNQTVGCSYYGQPTPSNPTACNNSASISATQQLNWTFSGSMGASAEGATFGASYTTSQSTTYAAAASCGGPVPLNGFCLACSNTSFLTWHNVSEDANCGCSDMLTGIACSDTENGTLTTFTGLHCIQLSAQPSQPCNPNCPAQG
jgi:hypothetical protein